MHMHRLLKLNFIILAHNCNNYVILIVVIIYNTSFNIVCTQWNVKCYTVRSCMRS